MGFLIVIAALTFDCSASAGKLIDRVEKLQTQFARANKKSTVECGALRAAVDQATDEVQNFAQKQNHSPSDFVAVVKMAAFAMSCLQDPLVAQLIQGLKSESPALGAAYLRAAGQLDPCRRGILNDRVATVGGDEGNGPAQPSRESFNYAACLAKLGR